MPVIDVIEISEELYLVAKPLLNRKIPACISTGECIRNRGLTDADDLIGLIQIRYTYRKSHKIIAYGCIKDMCRLVGYSLCSRGAVQIVNNLVGVPTGSTVKKRDSSRLSAVLIHIDAGNNVCPIEIED